MALRIYGFLTFIFVIMVLSQSCKLQSKEDETGTEGDAQRPLRVVFVTGDEEYRSEESMPMLAKLVKRELGAEVTVCYALDSLGFIDPNRTDHIEGLEALKLADLMVIFTRFRALPAEERQYILDYVESVRPIVGFRTATHAFKYENDSTLEFYNDKWPAKVFGQQWITHHGHFDDGRIPLTAVAKIPEATHPILNGFENFEAYSWLYHVDGGAWQLQVDCNPLLMGTSLKSQHQMDGKLEEYPLTNPVAWTKSYTGIHGKTSRVFFTTLGHPYDFKLKTFRTLALNGIFWALGKEKKIPETGVESTLDEVYAPNNSGFGKKYKLQQRPVVIE